MQWNFKINAGTRISHFIQEESHLEILNLLRVELNMFLLYNPNQVEDDLGFETRQLMYIIMDDIESVSDGSFSDSWDSIEELATSRLEQFYEFCKDHRILVSYEDVIKSSLIDESTHLVAER